MFPVGPIATFVLFIVTSKASYAGESNPTCPWDAGLLREISTTRKTLVVNGVSYHPLEKSDTLNQTLTACEMHGAKLAVSQWTKAEKQRGFVETKKDHYEWELGRSMEGRKESKKNRDLLVAELRTSIPHRPVILEERRLRNRRLSDISEALCSDVIHPDTTKEQLTGLMVQALTAAGHTELVGGIVSVKVKEACKNDPLAKVQPVADLVATAVIEERKRSPVRSGGSRRPGLAGLIDLGGDALELGGEVVSAGLAMLPEDTRRELFESAANGSFSDGPTPSRDSSAPTTSAQSAPKKPASASGERQSAPQDAGTGPNWVFGKITYRDGSPSGGCPISAATSSGVTKTVNADSHGNYRIELANPNLEMLFINGDRVWQGSDRCRGGCRHDLTRR